MVKELAYLSKWQNALAYLSKWQNALAYPSQMAVFQFVCSSLFRGLKSDSRIQRDLFVKFCILNFDNLRVECYFKITIFTPRILHNLLKFLLDISVYIGLYFIDKMLKL